MGRYLAAAVVSVQPHGDVPPSLDALNVCFSGFTGDGVVDLRIRAFCIELIAEQIGFLEAAWSGCCGSSDIRKATQHRKKDKEGEIFLFSSTLSEIEAVSI